MRRCIGKSYDPRKIARGPGSTNFPPKARPKFEHQHTGISIEDVPKSSILFMIDN